jgi:hypothetical protein
MVDQTGAAPTAKEIAEHKEARLKMWTAVLGLLTAVFVLLTGFFVKKTDTATNKVDTTQEQVKILASKNAALEADNAQKDARIARLEASQSAGPVSSDDPLPPDTAAPAVFHRGPLVLKLDNQADLDALPEQTQWNVNGTAYDISISDDSGPSHLHIYMNSNALLSSQEPSFATCHDATGYSAAEIPMTKLAKAKTLCVLTDEGRYSALKVKSATALEASFDVTTYSKAGD